MRKYSQIHYIHQIICHQIIVIFNTMDLQEQDGLTFQLYTEEKIILKSYSLQSSPELS